MNLSMSPLLSPVDKLQLRTRPILTKRFLRIALISLTFVLFTGALVWHNQSRVAALLTNLRWMEQQEQERTEVKNEVVLEKEKIPEFYPFTTTSSFFPVQIDPTDKTTEELCATFPKYLLETIQPVLKMGHGENAAKVEAQFDSVSACFSKDDLLVFSDLDEKVRGHDVIDILADLPVDYYENSDFQNYIWQKEMKANGTLKEKEAAKRIDGWILDKYKFLPMVERAWKMKPNKPFYFFFETDTYVFWDNAFRFLQTFDPDVPIYMGSPSPGRFDEQTDIETWFANGGPGFVLSRGAIKALLHRRIGPSGQYLDPPLTEKWLELLKGECCGDSALGWALWNASVPLQGYWPMFNPHPLHSIPYSDSYWCQPALTLHKTLPSEMVDLWRWEFGRRQLGRPLVYEDLWEFQHPGKPEALEHWDNGDWDGWLAAEDANIDSFEACAKLCEENNKCIQWNWRGRDDKKCLLMGTIRYGKARAPEVIKEPEQKDEQGNVIPPPKDRKDRWIDFKAGWVTERVRGWRKSKDCSVVQWVGPSITRIF
ncbi:Fc.00g027650.m01.CDS01 [Cosmosporella sp. VM-42]